MSVLVVERSKTLFSGNEELRVDYGGFEAAFVLSFSY